MAACRYRCLDKMNIKKHNFLSSPEHVMAHFDPTYWYGRPCATELNIASYHFFSKVDTVPICEKLVLPLLHEWNRQIIKQIRVVNMFQDVRLSDKLSIIFYDYVLQITFILIAQSIMKSSHSKAFQLWGHHDFTGPGYRTEQMFLVPVLLHHLMVALKEIAVAGLKTHIS